MKSYQKRCIFVEGNISSGKSTLLRNLEHCGYSVFQEGLDVWKNRYVEKNGENILGMFYKDMKAWSFTFEVAVMNTRYQTIMKALESDSDTVIIERSLLTDMKVFAPNLYSMGEMTDMQWVIYEDWHTTFLNLVEKLLSECRITYVYIRTTPEICFERKIGRDRREEKEVIPEYLFSIHERHETWLNDVDNKNDVRIINGNSSEDSIMVEVEKIIREQ